jgi:hypothetical protein
MLHHLEELAEGVGIEVRYQAAAGRVGICVLHGSRVAVVDANLRVPDRIAALLSVLAEEDLSGVYIPPEVRRRLLGAAPLRVRPEGEQEAPCNPNEDGEPEAGEEGVGAAETADAAADEEDAPPADEDAGSDQADDDDAEAGHTHEDDTDPEAGAD